MRSDPLALWEDIRLGRSFSRSVIKAHNSRCCDEVCIIAVILCVDRCFRCEKKFEKKKSDIELIRWGLSTLSLLPWYNQSTPTSSWRKR